MSEKSKSMVRGVETEHGEPKQRVYRDGTACGDDSVSLTVIEALAEARGVRPMDIDTPLYDAVDPEALDALFDTDDATTSARVVFEIDEFEVTVTSDEDVFVRTVK